MTELSAVLATNNIRNYHLVSKFWQLNIFSLYMYLVKIYLVSTIREETVFIFLVLSNSFSPLLYSFKNPSTEVARDFEHQVITSDFFFE